MLNKIEISEETLRGLYIIMCGLPTNQSGEVYEKAIPFMNNALKEVIKLGEERGFDSRGGDL